VISLLNFHTEIKKNHWLLSCWYSEGQG